MSRLPRSVRQPTARVDVSRAKDKICKIHFYSIDTASESLAWLCCCRSYSRLM